MFTEYKNLPQNSRVWIYQSDRKFTAKEIEFISVRAEDFINQWTRHGDDLKGSFIDLFPTHHRIKALANVRVVVEAEHCISFR